MITQKGKNIIGKYLIGQAPAFASYIAVGCGPTPLPAGESFTQEQMNAYTAKDTLDFEMFRVPIVSRGYVTEGGVSKIVLTAELPTEDRYEITELGLFSAGSNPSATNYDSRNVLSFSESEIWQYHSTSLLELNPIISPLDSSYSQISGIVDGLSTITITTTEPHSFIAGDSVSIYGVNPTVFNLTNAEVVSVTTSTIVVTAIGITGTYLSGGYVSADSKNDVIRVNQPIFRTNANNRIFSSNKRIARYENCRFQNNIIAMRGDTSNILENAGVLSLDNPVDRADSDHIHLSGFSINLSKNAPRDEFRLAFSVVNKVGNPIDPADVNPDEVRIIVEFTTSDDPAISQSAKMYVTATELTDSRYVVATSALKDLDMDSGFSWNDVTMVKIYACVIKDGSPSNQFYVCLDALRFENVTTVNPLYGMTGYSIVRTNNSETITKIANTSNSVEFRLAVGVQ